TDLRFDSRDAIVGREVDQLAYVSPEPQVSPTAGRAPELGDAIVPHVAPGVAHRAEWLVVGASDREDAVGSPRVAALGDRECQFTLRRPHVQPGSCPECLGFANRSLAVVPVVGRLYCTRADDRLVRQTDRMPLLPGQEAEPQCRGRQER